MWWGMLKYLQSSARVADTSIKPSSSDELKLVYIASPYSHVDKQVEMDRFVEITKVSAKLHSKHRHAFIMPITQSHIMRDHNKKLGTSFKRWAERDLKFISRCDEVWVIMMQGWKESIGVTAEIDFAIKQGIKVVYLHPKTLKEVQSKPDGYVITGTMLGMYI